MNTAEHIVNLFEKSIELKRKSIVLAPVIAEATRDARRAAEQFAEDSGSRVGGIRNAQQARDRISSWISASGAAGAW